MAYGSTSKTEERAFPVVGTVSNPTIVGNSIESMELSEDGTRFTVTFIQPNGSYVKHTEFDNEADWAQDQTSRRVRHIATKIVSDEEYSATIKETTSFSDFISKVMNMLGKRYEGMKFTMLFVYNNKGYVSLPKYPNFIERDGTTPSTITLNAYNAKWLVRPEVTKATEKVAEIDQLPF